MAAICDKKGMKYGKHEQGQVRHVKLQMLVRTTMGFRGIPGILPLGSEPAGVILGSIVVSNFQLGSRTLSAKGIIWRIIRLQRIGLPFSLLSTSIVTTGFGKFGDSIEKRLGDHPKTESGSVSNKQRIVFLPSFAGKHSPGSVATGV